MPAADLSAVRETLAKVQTWLDEWGQARTRPVRPADPQGAADDRLRLAALLHAWDDLDAALTGHLDQVRAAVADVTSADPRAADLARLASGLRRWGLPLGPLNRADRAVVFVPAGPADADVDVLVGHALRDILTDCPPDVPVPDWLGGGPPPPAPLDELRAAWVAAGLPPPDWDAARAGGLEAVLAVLDRLAEGVGDPPPPTAAAVLDRCRAWAKADGFDVLPSEWTFAGPAPAEVAAEDGITTAYLFRAAVPPGGVAAVSPFGVRDGTGVRRPATVWRSAGSLPKRYRRLLDCVAGPGPGKALADRLNGWPQAQLENHLADTATDFFCDYYAELGDDLRAADAALARRFEDELHQLMELNFGLTAFRPRTIWDYPDGWYRTVGPAGGGGRVRRVLRPGLRDADDRLRVPALVEVA